MNSKNDFHDDLQDMKEDIQDNLADIKDEFIDVGMELKDAGVQIADSFKSAFGVKPKSRIYKSRKYNKSSSVVDTDKKAVFIKLECPSCGADLQNINALNPGKCAYCGEKIIIDDSARMQAELQLKELEHEQIMFDKRQERRKEAARESRKNLKWAIPLLIFMILLPLSILGIGSYFDSKRIDRLHEIEEQVEEYYLAGDYDAALLKANQLVYDGTWSDSKVWDEKRENLIEVIEKAKAEHNK